MKEKQKESHRKYFERNLQGLPHHYTSNDTMRMTLGMFCLGGLDLLGTIENEFVQSNKQAWIDWIYDQQFLIGNFGFCGGPFMGKNPTHQSSLYNQPHITMTYTALISLLILGDDLQRVKKTEISSTLYKFQRDNGNFSPVEYSDEQDLRFVFCACAIAHILDDFSGFDVEKTVSFIISCQNYDGGFGTQPQLESHGGTTYCAVAALNLLGKLDLVDSKKTIQWLVSRQDCGFHGRMNKPDDTCYAYWIGASLKIFGLIDLIDKDKLINFLNGTETKFGGYSKYADGYPDVMHSYMGLAGLSLIEFEGLEKISASLGISERAWNQYLMNKN